MDRELDMTEADLLASIEQMLAPAGDGMTTAELAERLLTGPGAVRARLHQLNKQGRLVLTRKRITRLDGNQVSVPAYKLKDDEETKMLKHD